MTEHFIQYIDIERYKCFSDFSAHGFQRINLIAGKNNVGKTALMEALFINVRSTNISNMFDSLFFMYTSRKKTDYAFKKLNQEDASANILKHANLLKNKTNIQSIYFKTNNSDYTRKFEININDSNNNISEKDMDIFSISKQASNQKIAWISSSRDSQVDIISSFTSIQEKDREDDLNRFINSFDSEIEKVKVIGDVWGIQNAMVAVNTSANAEIKLEVGDSVVFKRKGEIIDGKIIGINSNVLIVEYGKGKKTELKFDEVTKTNK